MASYKKGLDLKPLFFRPISLIMIYFLGLLILYLWGPMEWKTQNPFILYSFLFLAQGLIYCGYSINIKKMYRIDNIGRQNSLKEILNQSIILKWLPYLIILNLVINILFIIRTLGLASFSLGAIIDNFVTGITDAGAQYNSKFQSDNVFGGGILAPVYTLLSPILWPVLPLSLIYFRKLRVTSKILVILTIIFEVIRWISIGTNKGIIDLILILISIIFLKQMQRRYDRAATAITKRKKRIRVILMTTLLLIIGISVFNNNITSRINENYNTVSALANYTPINLESPLMRPLPDNLKPLLVYTSFYLTQGYYGLSLTFDEQFVPMFGLGNSYFMLANVEQLLGVDLWKYTYQSRIEDEGWKPLVNWHSMYSWLANDFTYLGVLVLMYFLGKYFAVIYYRSLVYKDPISSVLFCLLLISFFYFPANNQVLSTPSMFMAFWGLNGLWFYKKVTKRRRKSFTHLKMSKSSI